MNNKNDIITIVFIIVSLLILYTIYESYFKKIEGFENILPKDVLFGNTETTPIHIWNNNIKTMEIVGKKNSDKPLFLYVPDFNDNTNSKNGYDNKYFGFTGTSSVNIEINDKNTLKQYNDIKAPLAHIKNTPLGDRPKDKTGKNSDIVDTNELNDLEKTPATWDYINNKQVKYDKINQYDKIAAFGINHSLIDVIQNNHMIKINDLLSNYEEDTDISNNNNINNDLKKIINIIKNFNNINLIKLSTNNHDFNIGNIDKNEIKKLTDIKEINALIKYYTEKLSNKHTSIINRKSNKQIDDFKDTRNTTIDNININNINTSLSLKTIIGYFKKLKTDIISEIKTNKDNEINELNIKMNEERNFSDEIKNDFKFNYIKMYNEYNLGNGNNKYELKPILINPLNNKVMTDMIKDKSGNIQYDKLKSISIPFGVNIKLYPDYNNTNTYTEFEIPYYHKDNLIYNIYFKKIFTPEVFKAIEIFHDDLVSDYKNTNNKDIYKYIYYTKSLIKLKSLINDYQNKLTDNNRQTITSKLSVLYDLSIEYLVAIYEDIMNKSFNLTNHSNNLINEMPNPTIKGCDTIENFIDEIGPLAQKNDNAYYNSFDRINYLQQEIMNKTNEIKQIRESNEYIYSNKNNEFQEKKYKEILNLYNTDIINNTYDSSKYSYNFINDLLKVENLNTEIENHNNEINNLNNTRFYEGIQNNNKITEGFNNPNKIAKKFYKQINSNNELDKYLAYKNKVLEVSKNDKELIEEEALSLIESEGDILLKDHKGEELKYLGQKIDYSLEKLNVNRLHIYYDKNEICKNTIKTKNENGPHDYDSIEYKVLSTTQQYIIDKSIFKYKMQQKLINDKTQILIDYLKDNINTITTVIEDTRTKLKSLKDKLKQSNMTYKYIEIYEPKQNEMPQYHMNIGQLIQLHNEQQGNNRPDFVGYDNNELRKRFTTIPKYCWLKIRDWKKDDIIWEKEFTSNDNSTVSYIAFYKNPYTNTIMVSTKKDNPPPNSSVGKIVPCPDKGMQVDRLVEHNKRAHSKCMSYSNNKDKYKLITNKADDILDEGLEKRIYEGSKEIELLKQRAQELKDENIKANVINSEYNKSRMQTYLRQQKKDIDMAMKKLQSGRNRVDVNVSYPISIIDNIIDIIANSDNMKFEDKKVKIKQLNEVKKQVIYGKGEDYKKNVAKIMKDCPAFDMSGLFKKPVPCYGCNI